MLDAHQLLLTHIATGACLLMFGAFLWRLLRLRNQMQAANGWTVVDGVVLESRVEQPSQHFSDELNDASPIVRYRYRVGDRDFEADRIEVGGSQMTTRALAARRIAKYSAGLHVDVYADPSDPAKAVLEPTEPGNIATALTLSIVFAAATILLAAQSIAGKVIYTANGVPLFAFALPAAAITIAVLGFVSFFRARRIAKASAGWPTVPGAIVQSSIIEERIEDPDNEDKSIKRLISRYQLDLRYRYRIGTRDYVGLVANWGWAPVYALRELAEAAAARYRQGQAVTVYYNPDRPAEAVLEPTSRSGSAAPLVFAVIFGLAGLGMLLFFIKVGFSA